MEAYLSSQMQEAWLLNRQSSTASWSSPNLYCGVEDYKPLSSDHTTMSCSEITVEAELASYSMPFSQISSFLEEWPSPALDKSTSDDDMGDSSIAPFEVEDVLMIDRPFLEYINEMLMEEEMADRTCLQQDCITYQSIANGFSEILGDHTASFSSQSPADDNDNDNDNDNVKLPLVVDDEYSWIDQVLNSNPSTPLPGSRTSLQSSFRQEKEKGSDAKPWVKDSSAQFPNFQDDGGASTGATVFSHGNSFASAQISQLLMNVSATPSGVAAGASFYSDTGGPPNRNLLQRKGNHAAWEEDTGGGGGSGGGSGGGGIAQTKGGQQQSNGRSLPSSTAGDLSFVKNEDLNIEEEYANLYIGECSPRSLAARDKGSANKKKSNSAVSRSKGRGKGNMEVAPDLKELLVSCAQAVGRGEAKKATNILQELRQQGASPNGSGLHRMAHYFSEALVARMCGTGGRLYTATSNNQPSAAELVKAYKMVFEMCPFIKLSHYFANQSILKAAEGASRLHIVDYGILYGVQWPYLINALADRKGGPPLLVITGIEFPQPGPNPDKRVAETGRRLAEYASTYNVPFEYHSIATSKWEDVEPASLHLTQGEVLVVNCIIRLRHLLDETVLASSPRQKVLSRMRSLNPNLLVTAVLTTGQNGPFFFSRFREALDFFSNKVDMMDTTWPDDSPERMIVERHLLCREILNVVACEGAERVERPETYKGWQARIQRAGFEQLPIISNIMSRSRSHVKNHSHKDFNVHDDSNGWMLLGWKGRIAVAISAWKPI